ncbi:MAG TPA: hypothetical protein VFL76_08040 [Edaphocola sp.]|nr:hypothetical protein [Edaphocola sp.]
MRRAILTTASLWYTAWANAGKPEISSLDSPYLYDINRQALRREAARWARSGRLLGMRSTHEF